MKPFFVYMLRCRNGSYYVGHTDDRETRIAQHVEGTYGGHTSRQRPVTFVWCAECDTRDEALSREWQLKKWSRAKKEALIRENWSRLKELARGPSRAERLRRVGVDESGGALVAAGSPFDSGPGHLMDSRSVRGLVPGPYAQGERECVLSAAPVEVRPDRSVRGLVPGPYAQGERECVLSAAPVEVRPDREDPDA